MNKTKVLFYKSPLSSLTIETELDRHLTKGWTVVGLTGLPNNVLCILLVRYDTSEFKGWEEIGPGIQGVRY